MSHPVHLVVGATGAVGSALARRLAARGDALVLLARDGARLAPLATELGALPVVGDATVPADVDAAVAAAVERFGRLDGAANCVGSVLLKPAHLTKDDEFRQVLETNLMSSFFLLRAAVRAFGPDGGSVVFCSTAAAKAGLPNHEAIAAAKGGIEGMARSAAATYAGRRIRINCVAPGLVRSAMTARIINNEAALKASLNLHALQRLGEPEEVASAIAFLLDPANSWVTAQVLAVDGGLGTLKVRAGS